jgi:hypothetical protein
MIESYLYIGLQIMASYYFKIYVAVYNSNDTPAPEFK